MKKPDQHIIFAYALGFAWLLLLAGVIVYMHPSFYYRSITTTTAPSSVSMGFELFGMALVLPFWFVLNLRSAQLILYLLVLLWGTVLCFPIFSGYSWARMAAYRVLWTVLALALLFTFIECFIF